ncbi:MAG TPA: FAD-linked oxidase C-terminal domain-containing protein [Gaiellales bacterium]|nr:FAD-linked oxidase C-terminal domain-containing protein [Gaiellales bacterium]
MEAGRHHQALAAIVGAAGVRSPAPREYLSDGTAGRGLEGWADLVVLPGSTDEVAAVVDHCYANDLAITTRGGGTGFAGGAVPQGGIVLGTERMARVRAFDPLLWRIHVEAGLPTAELQRLVRGSGLRFPPDPGAAEQSQIGGNVATNAGGPHAFKYGTTRAWVTGIEAVIPPGEVVTAGGPLRKDVAGYDLIGLLTGSEGTLGIVTAVWLRLIPAAEAALPVAGLFPGSEAGCAAVEALMGSGVVPACIEYVDEPALAAVGRGFPGGAPGPGFLVLTEADGSAAEAVAGRDALREALDEAGATWIAAPEGDGIRALWTWRDSISPRVTAVRGGKLAEDVAVPVDRLAEALRGATEIGGRHGLEAMSWGHAGDGNIHTSYLVAPGDIGQQGRAEAACEELFDLALRLGGTVTGEHGIGLVKRSHLAQRLGPAGQRLNFAIKRAFDPKGLLNPGKG